MNDKAPTAVFGAYGPATDAQYAISVLLEESGYGGSVAAPVARRLFDVLRDPALLPPAPEDGKFEILPTLAPDAGGGARLMTAATTFSARNRVAPGALGRLSRNPAAPWRHIDMVLVGSVVAVSALGCLMIFSATRGRDPSDFDTSFLAEAAPVRRHRRRGDARRRPHRLPALPRDRPDRVRRDPAPAAHGGHRVSAASARAARPGSSSGPFQLQPSELAKIVVIVVAGVA